MADVERERVTALWREAAARLAPAFAPAPSGSMWNTRTLALCLLSGPVDGPVNVGLARDLARAALESDAECGRLRDALCLAAVRACVNGHAVPRTQKNCPCYSCRARAALGVEGEPDKP